MFITKLNHMFDRHGRKTFAVITGIIIVTFVLYFSPGFDFFGLLSQKNREAGLLEGTGISQDELNRRADYVILQAMLNFPHLSFENDSFRQYAYPQAVEQVFLLRAAEKRGINVDDKSVADKEREAQAFKKDGKFSMAEYERFVNDRLVPFGISKEDLDAAVRDELIVKRLGEEIKSGVICSPSEIRTAFDADKEKTKVKAFSFDKKDFLSSAEADEKSAETFFNTKRGEYTISPKLKAQIFRFDYAGYEAKAGEALKDEDVAAHYEKTKFKYKEKNEQLPLEKVKDKVKKDLAERNAKDLALNDANAFAGEIYDIFEKNGDKLAALNTVKKLAEDRKIAGVETDTFSSDDTSIKNVGDEAMLVKELAKIQPDFPVSNAVRGVKAAFVAFLLDRIESRPAEFAEVKDKAVGDLKNEKALQMAREKAKEAALKLSKALAEGKKFDEAVAGIKFEDVKEFSADANPPGRNGSLIAELSAKTRKGAVSELENTPEGAFFIYVESRTLPSDEDFKKEEATFTAQYKSEKEEAVYSNYIADLLKDYTDSKKKENKDSATR